MTMRSVLSALLLLVVLTTTGCFDQFKQAKEAAETISRAAEELASGDTSGTENAISEAQKLLGGGEKVQPVDFRTLRDLLPETLPGGLTRTDASGERSSTMGISTSKVTGTYEGDGRPQPRVRITINDLGSMRGLGKFANSFEASVDREDSQGYERTTEYRGYKATEKFRDTGTSQNGSISVLVEDRFAVEVEGNNVPMETIKGALDRLDVDRLVAMKDEGVGVDDGSSERLAERVNEAARQAQEAAEEQARRESGPNAPASPLTTPDASGEADAAPREAVDFRELKALLPEQAGGLSRSSSEGQKQQMGEFAISSAEATYAEEDGDGRITVTITDMPVGGGFAMAGASWMMMEMERESDTGFERTTEYRGLPAYEKFQRKGDRTAAEKQVAVDRRFLIKVEGRNVEMDAVEAALDRIDLDALQRLGQPSS